MGSQNGFWVAQNNWSTTSKKPVANRVLWEELFNLTKNQNVEWVWVRDMQGYQK